MFFQSLFICMISFTISILVFPCNGSLLPRGASASTTNATINATIIDHAGAEMTSSFDIRLYIPPITPSLTTNNSLSNRQASFSRPIDTCSGGGTFMESYCTPEHHKAGSLQSYTIICHHVVPIRGSTPHVIPNQGVESRPRNGHCADDEICVSGLGAGRSKSGRRMASCVRAEYFIKYLNWGDNHQQPGLSLTGMMASMVMSQEDGTTPIEVDSFEIDTETTSASTVRKTTCKDCVELTTEPFGPDADALKMETTLLTTGAMTGVLWLAIMSG